MKLTGAEIIMEVLIEQGVTDIFGYPGGTVLNIYEALYNRQDKIHHYITAHEQGIAKQIILPFRRMPAHQPLGEKTDLLDRVADPVPEP